MSRSIAEILASNGPPLTGAERRAVDMVKAAFPGAKVIRHRSFCATKSPGVDAGAADCNCGAERKAQVGPRERLPPSQLSLALAFKSRLQAQLSTLTTEAAHSAASAEFNETRFRQILSDIKSEVERYEHAFNQAVSQLDMDIQRRAQ